jgi:transposase
LLEDLNARRMRHYGASRRELFERYDRPWLRPLPPEAFIYGEWKRATVNVDYHINVEHHLYSVPHALVHDEIEARVTATTVEIFRHGERVTSHLRSHQRGGYTTKREHMPKAHQKHLEWPPSRLLEWAGTIGPNTRALATAILESRPHPEQGYRSCLGILRLAKQHGHDRLEAAAARSLAVGARSYRHVESILKHGLDRLPPLDADEPRLREAQPHENIRGGEYYH